MPRARGENRGGARQGKPGVAHGQRTDLNQPKPLPVLTAPQDGYGERKALEDQQRAVPIPAAASTTTATPAAGLGSGTGTPPPVPLPIDRPTERPNEPMQAGLAMGAGPGPEALGLADTAESMLRAIYLETGDESIRELVEAIDEGR